MANREEDCSGSTDDAWWKRKFWLGCLQKALLYIRRRAWNCSGSTDDAWWNRLPQDLQQEALAWLPAERLTVYQKVCMEWNDLFSPSKLLSGLWVNTPINGNPWLLLWHRGPSQRCYAYSFYTQTWKVRFSLPFLSGDVDLGGSAGGRILLFWPGELRASIIVDDPLAERFLVLPQPLSIVTIRKCAISEGQPTNNIDGAGVYNVVIIGSARDTNVASVEIYDSSTDLWRIVGNLENMPIIDQLIFCDGYFYTLVVQYENGVRAMTLVFSMQQEPRVWKVTMPTLIGFHAEHVYYLIRCGPQLLMVSVNLETKLFIIWKLHKNSSNSSFWWEEIARMPASLAQGMASTIDDPKLEIIGVGDRICFMSIIDTGVKILVYNLSEKSWDWLPTFPLHHHDAYIPPRVAYADFHPTAASERL